MIELYGGAEVEKAVVRVMAPEVGQGIHTTLAQMAASALGLPLENVELAALDTDLTPSAGSASASRMLFMAGNAILGTADAALEAWRGEERPAIGEYTYVSPETTGLDPETGKGYGSFANAYLAQAAEIEVDTQTGEIRVIALYCAHDVGRAINPQVVEGQIQGGAIQGMGGALMENFITSGGDVKTAELSTYLIPTVMDVPERFEALIIEKTHPIGPWGATGVGEMTMLSIAPAIAAALASEEVDLFLLAPV